MSAFRERMVDLFDWYARAFPARILKPLTLPVGRHLKTNQCFLHESARMIETAFGFVWNNEVKGDYLEFGVYKGRTFVEAWDAARRRGMRDIHFYAFDSFRGLPEISGQDVGGEFQGGQFSAERKAFEKTLSRFHVDPSRVTVVEGFFDQTLSQENRAKIPVERAAVVWIDCDLYESTVPVLDFITDKLVDGAVLIFDDWYCFKGNPDRGEQRACTEWLKANPQIRLVDYQNYHWAGRSFIVNRSDGLA